MDAREIARVAEIYLAVAEARRILVNSDIVSPNDVAQVYRTARLLHEELIPSYIKSVPRDIQECLNLDVRELTERCARVLETESCG